MGTGPAGWGTLEHSVHGSALEDAVASKMMPGAPAQRTSNLAKRIVLSLYIQHQPSPAEPKPLMLPC
jgi:hypothetical protein